MASSRPGYGPGWYWWPLGHGGAISIDREPGPLRYRITMPWTVNRRPDTKSPRWTTRIRARSVRRVELPDLFTSGTAGLGP